MSVPLDSPNTPAVSNQNFSTPSAPPRILLCTGLMLLSIAAYWRTFSNGFVNFDDPHYILENPLIAKGLTLHSIALAFRSTMEANWHPLTWISHMLDVQLFGFHAAGHHASSLVLHGCNAVLLFLLLDCATGFRWRSGMVAALFAIHPLNVECVAWVAERKSLLSAFFLFIALFAYGWYARRPGVFRYLSVVLAFALSLASKPMAVTFPLLLLLVDYWPLQRLPVPGKDEWNAFWRRFGRLSLEKLPLFLLVIASSWITFYAQREGGAVASSAGLPLSFRVSNALYSYLLYVWQGVYPVRLAVFYPHPEGALPLCKPLIAAVFLIGISWLVWRYRDKRFLATGWLWYLGSLVPVIGIVQVGRQAMADRYAYLPFIGLFLIVVWAIAEAARHLELRTVLAPVGAIVLVWFAALTWWQTGFWKNSISLFGRALAVTRDNYMAENNLGMAYSESGQANLALAHFQKAARIRPKFSTPHYNLGLAFRAQGNLPAAENEFQLAIQYATDPLERAQSLHNLGIVLYEENRLDDARKELQAALAVNPDKENTYLALGMIEYRSANYAKALANFQRAYELHPSPQAMFWIARIREAQGDFQAAAIAYEATLRMSPTFREARERLEAILSGKALVFSPAH